MITLVYKGISKTSGRVAGRRPDAELEMLKRHSSQVDCTLACFVSLGMLDIMNFTSNQITSASLGFYI